MVEDDKRKGKLRNRRQFIRYTTAAATASTFAVAGCIGADGDGEDGGEEEGTDGGEEGTDGGDGTPEGPSSVQIPGLYDISGATSDVGRPTAIGSRDAITYINDNDLIGPDIEHDWVDYAYEVPQARQAYDEFTSSGNPPAIIGWGTADTEALGPTVAEDEIVYVSASYSANLLEDSNPYNFFGNLDYTSQARAHLKWVAENDPDAKVAFIFSNNPFGQAPVEGGRQYANELGLELGDNINLSLTANSARTQLQRAKQNDIDYLIHQNTAAPMQVLLQDRQEVYPEVNVMGLTYTVDEFRVQQSPDLFEGVRYSSAFKTFNEVMDGDSDGKAIIEGSFDREGRSMDNPEVANLNYVRGTIHALLVAEAIKQASEAGMDPSSGADLRQGMFEISDWDVMGLAEPFTYAEDDRRPTMNGRIYQVSDGAMEYDSTIELPRRDDWIGL